MSRIEKLSAAFSSFFCLKIKQYSTSVRRLIAHTTDLPNAVRQQCQRYNISVFTRILQ